MLMPPRVAAEAALPALSMQLPLLVKGLIGALARHSAATTESIAMPDCTTPVSTQLKETETSALFPAAGVRLRVAATADERRGLVDVDAPTVAAEAALPPLSTQSPLFVADWPAPSSLSVPPATGVRRDAGLDGARVCAGERDFDIGVVQPLAFASGSRLPLLSGEVLSILMPPTVATEAELPALSIPVAAVGDGLTGSLAANSRTGDGVRRDARLDRPGV